MTRFGKRQESLPDLMAEAARSALSRAQLEAPDALVVAAMNPEEFIGEGNFASHIATYLGLARVPALRVEIATSSGAAAVYAAFATVAAEASTAAWQAGSSSNRTGSRQTRRRSGRVRVPGASARFMIMDRCRLSQITDSQIVSATSTQIMPGFERRDSQSF